MGNVGNPFEVDLLNTLVGNIPRNPAFHPEFLQFLVSRGVVMSNFCPWEQTKALNKHVGCFPLLDSVGSMRVEFLINGILIPWKLMLGCCGIQFENHVTSPQMWLILDFPIFRNKLGIHTGESCKLPRMRRVKQRDSQEKGKPTIAWSFWSCRWGLGLLMLHRVGHAAHCYLAQRHNEKQNDQIAKYIKKARGTLRNVSLRGFPSRILIIYNWSTCWRKKCCTSW